MRVNRGRENCGNGCRGWEGVVEAVAGTEDGACSLWTPPPYFRVEMNILKYGTIPSKTVRI